MTSNCVVNDLFFYKWTYGSLVFVFIFLCLIMCDPNTKVSAKTS